MRARTLDQLEAAGLLERRDVDVGLIRRWMERARRDLALSQETLTKLDKERAATVAYEAGFRACAGLLGLAGFRVRSQPGHHRAALEAASHLVPRDLINSLDLLDDARRFRNESLYEEPAPMADADLAELQQDVQQLIAALEAKLRQRT